MGKSSPSPPAPPDPAKTAAAQGQANKEAVLESAKVNQINQVTPYGSLTYSGAIGSPDRTATTSLSPAMQQQFQSQNQLANALYGFAQNRAGQITPGEFNFEGIPELQTEFSDDASRVEQATYDRAKSLMDPTYQRNRERAEANLEARGIPIDAELYNNVVGEMDRNYNNALEAAAMDSVTAGRSEQSRMFGLNQQSRNQAISDELLQRTQPMNELAAILQGAPALQTPNFGGPSQYQIAPGDFQGAQALNYQGRLNNYNQNVASQNAAMGGLFGLGGSLGAAAIMSDRRAKTDIRRVGMTDGGLPVYTYRYKGGAATHMGVMADEVETVTPEAVVEINGIQHVDYAMVE